VQKNSKRLLRDTTADARDAELMQMMIINPERQS